MPEIIHKTNYAMWKRLSHIVVNNDVSTNFNETFHKLSNRVLKDLAIKLNADGEFEITDIPKNNNYAGCVELKTNKVEISFFVSNDYKTKTKQFTVKSVKAYNMYVGFGTTVWVDWMKLQEPEKLIAEIKSIIAKK